MLWGVGWVEGDVRGDLRCDWQPHDVARWKLLRDTAFFGGRCFLCLLYKFSSVFSWARFALAQKLLVERFLSTGQRNELLDLIPRGFYKRTLIRFAKRTLKTSLQQQ